jgi:hypothetical protein
VLVASFGAMAWGVRNPEQMRTGLHLLVLAPVGLVFQVLQAVSRVVIRRKRTAPGAAP